MRKKMKIICNIIMLFCGLLLTIGGETIFKGCNVEDEIMKCSYSIRIVSSIGIIIICNSIYLLLSKKYTDIYVIINTIMLFGFSIIVPMVLIGGCKLSNMQCQMITFPMYYITSSVGLLFAIINVNLAKRKG